MTFRYQIRTRYAETGQDGIIHHSSYVVYLEAARIEFMQKELEFDLNVLEKSKIYCPVVDLSIKYLKPLYSLEDIDVEVALDAFSKVRFSMQYKIFRKGVQVTEATTSHCFSNEAFKPIAIPKDLTKRFQEIKSTE